MKSSTEQGPPPPPPSPPPPIGPSQKKMGALDVLAFGLGLAALGVIAAGGLLVWGLVSVWRADNDPENSPTIQRIEAEHPAMSDLNVQTGTRVTYARSGGEPGRISLSYSTGSWHRQTFAPLPGWTLDDVADEVVERAETEGYALVQDGNTWCAEAKSSDLELEYPLEIEIIITDPTPTISDEFTPHVEVQLYGVRC